MHHIFKDKLDLARYFGDYLQALTLQKDKVYIALSGGSTPKAIFEVLAKEYAKSIDWSKLYFFWGDERCVAPDHPESNFDMTKEYLFDYVPVKAINIFRVKGELKPTIALDDYRLVLDENLPKLNGIPQFDIMLLGMGDDGHTASIFPHQIELWQSGKTCEMAQHPESGQNRVTLTGKVINNSRQIFFLVTGSNKATKVSEILNKENDYKSYPASLVDENKTIWLMDNDAAQGLK